MQAALHLIAFIAATLILSALSYLAYWKGNPVIFLITAGVAIMIGLYTPDATSPIGYKTFGVGVGLMLIIYSFLCLGLAFANLFRNEEE